MKENPFNISMFASPAGGKDTVFALALAGGLLLLIILYTVRSRLRARGEGAAEAADQDLFAVWGRRLDSMVTRLLRRRPVREAVLSQLMAFDPSSANCTIIRAGDGREVNEEVGQVALFHMDGELFRQGRSFFITTPDGIGAKDGELFTGDGEVINLWFLRKRVPYTLNCRVKERVRFPIETIRSLNPRTGVGYRLVPLTNVAKQDKRQALRFSHKMGRGSTRVYPQVQFDVYVQKTDFRFPAKGSVPPCITSLECFPYRTPEEEADFSAGRVVAAFKEAIQMNPSENRVVHVSKPYVDEQANRRALIDLGFSEVVGLNVSEDVPVIHLKRPTKSRVKHQRDSRSLHEGDLVVLDHFIRSMTDGSRKYYETACQVIKAGIENIAVCPRRNPRQEMNLPIEMLDFSVDGMRFENSQTFVRYVFGEKGQTLAQQQEALKSTGFVFTFYPKLLFTRDTAVYKPDLPLKFSILGQIVRCEAQQEGSAAHLSAFGVRYTHDPAEYSVDDFGWDRWAMIHPAFRENRQFKEIHKSLNGLIAYLDHHPNGFLEPRYWCAGRSGSATARRKKPALLGLQLLRKG